MLQTCMHKTTPATTLENKTAVKQSKHRMETAHRKHIFLTTSNYEKKKNLNKQNLYKISIPPPPKKKKEEEKNGS